MSVEWLAAIVALIAAFIAAVAAIVAYSQAISAKRQAVSSEQAAIAASRQAVSAEQSARSADRSVGQEYLQQLQSVARSILLAQSLVTTLNESVVAQEELRLVDKLSLRLATETMDLRFTTLTVDQEFDHRLSAVVQRISAHSQNLTAHVQGTVRHMFEPITLVEETMAISAELDQLQQRLALAIETNRMVVQRA